MYYLREKIDYTPITLQPHAWIHSIKWLVDAMNILPAPCQCWQTPPLLHLNHGARVSLS